MSNGGAGRTAPASPDLLIISGTYAVKVTYNGDPFKTKVTH